MNSIRSVAPVSVKAIGAKTHSKGKRGKVFKAHVQELFEEKPDCLLVRRVCNGKTTTQIRFKEADGIVSSHVTRMNLSLVKRVLNKNEFDFSCELIKPNQGKKYSRSSNRDFDLLRVVVKPKFSGGDPGDTDFDSPVTSARIQ